MSDQDDNFDNEDAFDEGESSPAPAKKATKSRKKEKTPAEIAAERKADYKARMSRRWRCQVNSMRKGVQHFELIVPSPSNPDKPIPVRGHCGVIIEEGLTKYVIDQLQSEHHMELMEVPTPSNPSGEDQGLNHRSVPVYHYQVQVFEEVENPKPLGSVK